MPARILWPILWCLAFLPAAAAQDAPAEAPFEFYAEYATEDLDADPGVVALSGEIRVKRGEFELSVPDGGVVLWVDCAKWRELRRSAGDFGAPEDGAATEGEEAEPKPKEEDVGTPRLLEILGPVIRELYAEGGATLRRGRETVKAERLFYDFARNRAVILRSEVTYAWRDERRGFDTPLIVRAERLYQEAKDELHGGPARATTSMFAEPQYELTVRELTIRRRENDTYDLTGDGNVLRVGDLPVFWFPGISGNSETGIEPLKSARIGNSSMFGSYAEVTIGGGIRLSAEPDAPRVAEWYLNPVARMARGPGLGGGLDYDHPGVRGSLEGFYQYDGEDRDHVKDTEVPTRHRGRARLQHQQTFVDDLFGGRLSGNAEVSYLADRGYLAEYETNEYQAGKAQETVGYLSWAAPWQAASMTGRWQLNRFDTVTEYLPRAAYDLFDVPIVADVLGSGTDVFLSGEAEAAQVRRNYDQALDLRGVTTDRLQGRAMVSAPFALGPVKVNPEVGGGATEYGGGQDVSRSDAFAALRAGTDFWRVYPEVNSDVLDLSGLRHVIDVGAAWSDRFCVTEPSSELVVQDPSDFLDEVQAGDLRIRNRLQTKRNGKSVDWIDFELRLLFFPQELAARPSPFGAREEWGQGISSLLVTEEEKYREIDRKGFGPLTGDLGFRVREDVTLLGDFWYDYETMRFETFSGGIRYEAFPELAFFLGHRGIQGDSSIMTAWVEFRAGDRWELRLYQQTDFRDEGGLASGVVLRRLFPDFLFEFRVDWNSMRDEFSIGFAFEPRAWFEASRARREGDRDLMDYRGMRRDR